MIEIRVGRDKVAKLGCTLPPISLGYVPTFPLSYLFFTANQTIWVSPSTLYFTSIRSSTPCSTTIDSGFTDPMANRFNPSHMRPKP